MMKRILVFSTLAVIGFILFGIPKKAGSAEQIKISPPQKWGKTPGRETQWFKELGESSGDIRLAVEAHRGKVLYILMKRCAKEKQFYSLAWYKGAASANGYSCEGRHLYSTDLGSWEKRGGDIPFELLALSTQKNVVRK